MALSWPAGFISASGGCGIKPGHPDLAVLIASEPVAWAGAFTTNAASAAPVRWSRSLLGRPVRAVVVNSGNANACTGAAGVGAVEATATAAARALGCETEEILVASTGPIGVPLPSDLLVAAIPGLIADAGEDASGFAEAILTTDTRTKTATATCGGGTIVGVAKGAAMAAPNMATMLAFIATDLEVPAELGREVLREAVDGSFNRISIDGCESTNDSVFLLASGIAGTAEPGFAAAVADVCRSLAEQIVRDAEGATRFVRIEVEGAASPGAAADLGRAVAGSVLWRAAMNGGDPNWGRILAALGAADRALDVARIEVAIGSEVVFSGGEPAGSNELAAKVMAEPEYTVRCTVGDGPGRAEISTADLSSDYVRLNAEGTS